jgi:hypothetical protein
MVSQLVAQLWPTPASGHCGIKCARPKADVGSGLHSRPNAEGGVPLRVLPKSLSLLTTIEQGNLASCKRGLRSSLN